MSRQPEHARDRAIWVVRLATFGGVASAIGLTWLFSDLAQAYFSGQPAPVKIVTPVVPVAAVPVQKPPTVVQTVVHHPYQGGSTAPAPGAAPRPPAQAPAAAPPAPPAPVCHSTPSKPC